MPALNGVTKGAGLALARGGVAATRAGELKPLLNPTEVPGVVRGVAVIGEEARGCWERAETKV